MTLTLRELGQTGIKVSPLGIGTTKWGRNTDVKYPDLFKIPDNKQVLNLLSLAREHNVNLLDTAPAYGNCEERLGKLLKERRKDWIISSKAGEYYEGNKSRFDFSRKGLIRSANESLERLETDYIDIMLIHSDGNDQTIIEDYDVLGTLSFLKECGKIRAFGMSTKTVTGGILTVEKADIAMITYNPVHTEEKEVIEKAAELNKGILIKKPLASGHLNKIDAEDPVRACMEFIFAQNGVHSVITGTINQEHLVANIKYLEDIAT